MSDYSREFSPVDKIDAEKELKEACDALKKQGIKHWLSSGTLLGIYRDGKFLKDDTDIDIGIMTNEIPVLKGYELEIVRSFGDIMQTVYRSPRNIAIDLMWLDMQGAEFKVLKAAPMILNTVKVIFSEISLVEMYEGAPLYNQFRAWLKTKGFDVKKEEIVSKDMGNALFVKK